MLTPNRKAWVVRPTKLQWFFIIIAPRASWIGTFIAVTCLIGFVSAYMLMMRDIMSDSNSDQSMIPLFLGLAVLLFAMPGLLSSLSRRTQRQLTVVNSTDYGFIAMLSQPLLIADGLLKTYCDELDRYFGSDEVRAAGIGGEEPRYAHQEYRQPVDALARATAGQMGLDAKAIGFHQQDVRQAQLELLTAQKTQLEAERSKLKADLAEATQKMVTLAAEELDLRQTNGV
jgi:hypothetical protein